MLASTVSDVSLANVAVVTGAIQKSPLGAMMKTFAFLYVAGPL